MNEGLQVLMRCVVEKSHVVGSSEMLMKLRFA
jgi:hypothetical protein